MSWKRFDLSLRRSTAVLGYGVWSSLGRPLGGSLAHSGELDFLVEFACPNAFGYADRYFGLLESLEALFDRPVDLVVDSAIKNPYFRESVDKTKACIYES